MKETYYFVFDFKYIWSYLIDGILHLNLLDLILGGLIFYYIIDVYGLRIIEMYHVFINYDKYDITIEYDLNYDYDPRNIKLNFCKLFCYNNNC